MTLPHLPSLPFLDVDTSRSKRTTQLGLNGSRGCRDVRGADVFLQAYHPHGFGHEECAALHPGIVHASLTGFLPGGTWRDVKSASLSLSLSRPSHFCRVNGVKLLYSGSLVQTLAGFNVQETEAYAEHVRERSGEEEAAKLPPYRALPMQALGHTAGYVPASGIAAALCKTVSVSAHADWE